MSAQLTFWYKRQEKFNTKEGDKLIECEDCINLYDVIRGWWKDPETFVLMMKDAHEEVKELEMHPKIKDEMKKAGKSIPKEKQWVASYIDLKGIDIRRYRAASELMIASTDLPVVAGPHLIPLPPPPISISTEKIPNPLIEKEEEPKEQAPIIAMGDMKVVTSDLEVTE